MFITPCEGRKQHSTCLAVPSTDPALSKITDTCHSKVFLGFPRISQGMLSWPCRDIWSACADGASQDGAVWTPAAPGARDTCGFGTSLQPTNISSGSHLSCRAAPSPDLQGETGSRGSPDLSEQAKTCAGNPPQEWRWMGKACLLSNYSELPQREGQRLGC